MSWGIITLVSESANLLQGLNNYTEKAYIKLQEMTRTLDISKDTMSNDFLSLIQNSSQDILNDVYAWGTKALSSMLNILTQIPRIAIYSVITVLSLYFICTDKIYILDFAEHHMPKKWVKKAGNHIREITKSLGAYLKAEITLVFITFVIALLGLYIFMFVGFNVKYPLLIALITAFVDALPILGSGTVLVPWALFSALDGDINLGISLVVLWIIICVVRQFVEPKVVSNNLGIHPIFTLIAMYTGFKLFGVFGLFMGPIALIIIKSICSTFMEQGIIKNIFDKNFD